MRFILLGALILLFSCKKEEESNLPDGTTSYELVYPAYFGNNFVIPENNPMTVEGVELGRKLFYDPILSKDKNISCANCHSQENGFSDAEQFSIGFDNQRTERHSMTLINLLWQDRFFWDGRSVSLEEQALEPIMNEIEMNLSIDSALVRLNSSPDYPSLFSQAFGVETITASDLGKAIAQFERTLISGNSKYDQYKRGEYDMTASEYRGMGLFFTHPEPSENLRGGNCGDCHTGFLTADRQFHNNGLDEFISDIGLENVTSNSVDRGKFKTPTMRNIAISAPYMHDGRFNTLEEVLDHYNEHIQQSATLDILITEASNEDGSNSLELTEQEKTDIVNFLQTLTDEEFLQNENFKTPF